MARGDSLTAPRLRVPLVWQGILGDCRGGWRWRPPCYTAPAVLPLPPTPQRPCATTAVTNFAYIFTKLALPLASSFFAICSHILRKLVSRTTDNIKTIVVFMDIKSLGIMPHICFQRMAFLGNLVLIHVRSDHQYSSQTLR